MSNYVRRPGPVEEETVPINSENSETEATARKSHPSTSDNGIKKKNAPTRRKPTQVHEPTEPTNPKLISSSDNILENTKSSYWSRLFWVFVCFVGFWLLYATIESLLNAWNNNIWLAVPLTIISVAFIIILVALVWREWRAIQSIDRIQETKRQLEHYIYEGSIVGVHTTLKPVLACIKINYPEEYRQFDEARHDRQTVKEYLSLLDNVVLSRLDEDVDDAIKNASLSVAGLVAISPHPALDAVIVMIRANMLLRKITQIYGLELTGFSSLYFFKHTIVSAITAAGVEALGTLVLEQIGAELTEKSAKVLAEGVVSASRMYRLGNLTKNITRPIPSTTMM